MGGGQNCSVRIVSSSRSEVNDSRASHEGASILTRRWRLSRRASQSGSIDRRGGIIASVGP